MARQVAALTRNTSYRHSPIPVKDSSFFGLNHTFQATPLTLNGHFNTTDYSVYRTPPEGPTPVDQKHFDYDEETLNTLQDPNNLPLSLYKLNDSGIPSHECLDSNDEVEIDMCSTNNEVERNKSNDDDTLEYHTPPETPDLKDDTEGPPFGFPPSEDELINFAVNNLLSKNLTNDSSARKETPEGFVNEREEIPNKKELVDELFEATQVEPKEDSRNTKGSSKSSSFNSETSSTAVESERDCLEKDSLDGSPHSHASFTQEEDDSGISIVDENDIVQESTVTNGGHFERKEYKFRAQKNNKEKFLERTYSGSNTTQRTNIIPEKKTYESELKYSKSNSYESEDATIGWQTRHKRMGKKRHDREFERDSINSDMNTAESKTNHKESTGRRSIRDGKNKNGKMDRTESYSKVAERNTDERYKEKNAKRAVDVEIQESSKRSGRRAGQASHAGKKSDIKWTKNGSSKDKYNEVLGKRDSPVQDSKSHLGVQPSVFSYRDALLKDGAKVPSAKDQAQTHGPAREDKMFNLISAVNYLSSAWTSVNNLHKKDPSKVYIYNGD